MSETALRGAPAIGERSGPTLAAPNDPARQGRPHVLLCVDNMGVGGTELNTLHWAERLDRSRFAVSVLCLQDHGPLLARYEELGIPVVKLPLRRLYGSTALRQGWWLARYLAAQHVDIVHTQDVYDNIFTTLCARLARRPVVIASRRWWDEVPRPALRAANRATYRLADCVVANSRAVAELLVGQEGVPAARVTVIPNCLGDEAFVSPGNTARRAFLSEVGVPAGAFVVGCVANLRPVKDHESLILAIASLRARWPEVHLVLVGDGPSRARLVDLARRLEIADAVHFAGTRPNFPNLHHHFDVSALASLSEASPNSLLEAMAAGRPVVATRVGGVPDMVIDGETALLVDRWSPEGLAASIERLLMTPTLRRTMGDAGQQRARERFGAAAIIAQLEALYTRLLGARTR